MVNSGICYQLLTMDSWTIKERLGGLLIWMGIEWLMMVKMVDSGYIMVPTE